jgi:hypothetical protein
VTFVDEAVRVEMNTHGGVVLHFAKTDRHPQFVVWSTGGGQWAINKEVPTPDPNGLWGNGMADIFGTLVDACWSRMNKDNKGQVHRPENAA